MHPFAKILEDRQRFIQAQFFAVFSGQAIFPRFFFYFILILNKGQCFFSSLLIIVPCPIKFSAGVCPTKQMGNLFFLTKVFIRGIAVSLLIAFVIFQYPICRLVDTSMLVIILYCLLHRLVSLPLIS